MEKIRRRSLRRKCRREFCEKLSSPLYSLFSVKLPISFSMEATNKKEESTIRRHYHSGISSLTTTATSRGPTDTVVMVAYEDQSERSFVGTLQEDVALVHVLDKSAVTMETRLNGASTDRL